MVDHWEILDVYKALFAIVAGIILGLERELKDKVAGLKTITIICLGATLFGILSYKVGGTNNPTHIAAYVVSGVGFLGAGAIFKDGFSISGLTTAGIIWLAAAVGLAIGFSEFYLAATFMGEHY
ncbi:MAG: MgtC/SapB family protein [Chitinophagaceae bacterium]|nr:MgtC/SapB family protein [Chitinophagaceae bacterium]